MITINTWLLKDTLAENIKLTYFTVEAIISEIGLIE